MTASEYVYVPREQLRVVMEGFVPPAKPGEDPTPGELTITLNTPDGPYDVTVPLGYVTVERLIPADGEPRPNEVWRDCSGTDRWAYLDSRSGEICLIGPDGIRNQWSHFNVEYGPLTRIYPPVSAAPAAPAGQAETGEPRLMLGDIWETPADGDWTVTDRYGHLMLSRGDLSERYDFTEQRRGPLRLVQRAGYRRTETTVPVWQLKIGQVVSRPEWADGAPVRFVGTFDDVRDLKIIYWPLGGDARSTGTAARDAEVTLWTEIDGGAR